MRLPGFVNHPVWFALEFVMTAVGFVLTVGVQIFEIEVVGFGEFAMRVWESVLVS